MLNWKTALFPGLVAATAITAVFGSAAIAATAQSSVASVPTHSSQTTTYHKYSTLMRAVDPCNDEHVSQSHAPAVRSTIHDNFDSTLPVIRTSGARFEFDQGDLPELYMLVPQSRNWSLFYHHTSDGGTILLHGHDGRVDAALTGLKFGPISNKPPHTRLGITLGDSIMKLKAAYHISRYPERECLEVYYFFAWPGTNGDNYVKYYLERHQGVTGIETGSSGGGGIRHLWDKR